MNEEQMRDLVKECGLDWQRGYILDENPSNRYVTLIQAVEAAERERCRNTITNLQTAVTLARNTFAGYAALHSKKGTPEGHEKAILNYELEAQMAYALVQSGQ